MSPLINKIVVPANSPLWKRASIDHLTLPGGGTPYSKHVHTDQYSKYPVIPHLPLDEPRSSKSMPPKPTDPFEHGMGTVINQQKYATKLVEGKVTHRGLSKADAYAAAEALSSGKNGAWAVLKGGIDTFSIAPARVAGSWKYQPDVSHVGDKPGTWKWENDRFSVSSRSEVSRLYSDGSLRSIVDGKVQIYPVNGIAH